MLQEISDRSDKANGLLTLAETKHLRHLLQWKTTIAAMIIFSGTSIGANDFIKYKTGSATLSSRTEYCQFIEENNTPTGVGSDSYQTLGESESLNSESDLIDFSKIWNLKKTLAAYRAKRISFSYLPRAIEKGVTEQRLLLTNEKLELEKSINAIILKIENPNSESIVQRHPSQYTQWQLKNEWPLQLKLLNEKKRKVEAQLIHLSERRLTDSELLDLMARSEVPVKESLMIEIRLEDSLFTSKVAFYPVWKKGDTVIAASESPWFRVQKKFLPRSTLAQMANRQTPPPLMSYLKVASRAYNNNEDFQQSGIQYRDDGRILLYGSPKTGFLSEEDSLVFTSPNDLAVEGLLDLACLQDQ